MADQVTKHKLPPDKGAGSVALYEVKAGHTPPVVQNPKDIEDKRWVLVLFPERWGWAVKSRAAGVREAKGDSATLAALVLKRTVKTKVKKLTARRKRRTISLSLPQKSRTSRLRARIQNAPKAQKTRESQRKSHQKTKRNQAIASERNGRRFLRQLRLMKLWT
jgi:hypothetical protein